MGADQFLPKNLIPNIPSGHLKAIAFPRKHLGNLPMILPPELKKKIALLSNLEPDSRKRLEYVEGVGTRVGRNDVWQLEVKNNTLETYFAKFWSSTPEFRRELWGLILMQKLATQTTWIMAVEIVFIDEDVGLVVTKGLKGYTFTELLQSAFRHDKGWVNRKKKKANVNRCTHQILDLIKLLQDQEVFETHILQDHSPLGAIDRINRSLKRFQANPTLNETGEISFLPFALQLGPGEMGKSNRLVHGDLSPGNIFFYNGKIGVIDFEDMGIGSPFREIVWLKHCLSTLVRNPLYANCAIIFELINNTEFFDEFELVYELDFSLFQTLSILQVPPLKNLIKRRLIEIEKRCAILKIRNLLSRGTALGKIVCLKS